MPKPPRFVILGNPENRRVQLFTAAVRAAGGEDPEVVAWHDYLRVPDLLAEAIARPCILRIESPGENFAVEKALLARGEWGVKPHEHSLSRAQLAALAFEKGRILPMPQWYRGWVRVLDAVERAILDAPAATPMTPPMKIAAMFDKAECHRRFAAATVPVPPLLGTPCSNDELMALLEASGRRRVFVKPCHGSSASGVVALELGRHGQQAFTSVELVREGGELRLYNSLRVRRYESAPEIAALLDAVCRERCIVEAWLPKAAHAGRTFDLRVLVITGRAAQVVMRQSAGPITNLHLGNTRGDLDALQQRMGDAAWRTAMSICESAAAVFPHSLHIAVDLLVAPSLQRFAVAEVNAFGDLLPGVLFNGRDTYATEIEAMTRGRFLQSRGL